MAPSKSQVKPYKIHVPQSSIDVLRRKVALTTFPDELDDSGWEMGPPLSEIKRLAKKWETFDWRATEKKINDELPQYMTQVDVDGFGSLDIHYVHQKSNVKNAIPLLFVHGWPGSFLEVDKILPALTSSTNPSFHVIAPSLPNFGFSSGVRKRGFALAQYAETLNKLMLQLGYPQYVTQSGDWGFWITRAMNRLYPENVKASHVNMIPALPPSFTSQPLLAIQHALTPYSEYDHAAFERRAWFQGESYGYNLLQSTKPETLGYSLADSPTGLLGWIYEKLHDWSDSFPWTDDEILTWVSVYAFSTAGPGAAQRIYYEVRHTDKDAPCSYLGVLAYNRKVPLGLAHNPKDLDLVPVSWGRTMGPVAYEVVNKDGGHFYAHERPEWLVRDLRAMFGKGGGAYGIVEGKIGY